MDDLTRLLTEREAGEPAEKTDPVIERALRLLNQRVNPVRVVTPDDYDAIRLPKALHKPTAGYVAFRVWRGSAPDEPIFVNRDSAAFQRASGDTGNRWANLLMASTLVHEQIHETEKGSIGEGAAMRKQADFIRSHLNDLRADERREAMRYLNAVERKSNELLKGKR